MSQPITLRLTSVAAIFYLTSCNSGQVSIDKPDSDTSLPVLKGKSVNSTVDDTGKKLIQAGSNTDSLQTKLKGAWTDGYSENAIFEIRDHTVFYVEQFSSYKYSLKGNIITIRYPDYSYKGKISFNGDTLVMDSEENGTSKYWKFKN